MNYTYEFEETKGLWSDPSTTERANAFIDYFQRRQTQLLHTYGEDFNGVFIPREDIMRFLGRNTYQSTLTDLQQMGFYLKNETNRYGSTIFYFAPNPIEFHGEKVEIKDPYLNRNITAILTDKKKNLSREAKIVFENLIHLQYNCSLSQFNQVMTDHHPTYQAEKRAINESSHIKKRILSLDDYIKANQNFYYMMEQFRQAVGHDKLNYIWEDNFGGRVHSILTCTPSALKKSGYLTLKGSALSSLDLKQSQPTILAYTLEERIGENDFSEEFNLVDDIYIALQQRLKITTRQAAKDKMFTLLYGKPDSAGQKLFNEYYPEAGSYISDLKRLRFKKNPSKKIHSNLVWIMQQKETAIFKEIWRELDREGLLFLPIHDEIVIESGWELIAVEIMKEVLSRHFRKFNINYK